MKQRSFKIRSLMIAIASYGIALTVIRWCGVRSPQRALRFSLGPLCGVYLHRHRGGNGIVGGAIGGIAVAVVDVDRRDTIAVKESSMPLRDHFRPPVSKKASWEGFHGMWPATVIQQLRKLLPPGYVAEPRVHLGTLMEIDVGALESHEIPRTVATNGNSGTATAAWTATAPVVSVETDPPDEYEYEVRIFDLERERTLVAAIEFVSPANKDRPESRRPLSPSVPPYSARGSL